MLSGKILRSFGTKDLLHRGFLIGAVDLANSLGTLYNENSTKITLAEEHLMAGTMENITKMALAEMIQNHATSSRFGFVISDEGYRDLIDTLYEFFETSRSLKSAGDRMLTQGPTQHRMPTSRIPR